MIYVQGMNFFVLSHMLARGVGLVAATAVVWLVSRCAGETVELRGGRKIEFTADLERSHNWGVQFQLVEGTVAFRVGPLIEAMRLATLSPTGAFPL